MTILYSVSMDTISIKLFSNNNRLISVTTDDPAAPEAVLNLICCKYSGGCRNRCGCQKAGIMCTDINLSQLP